MKRFLPILLIAVFASCSQSDDTDPDGPGADFALTGTVTEIEAGVDLPDGIPDIDATTDVGATATETDDASVQTGAVVVDADEDVEGCKPDEDGYTIFITQETVVEPLRADLDALQDKRVEVRGTFYETDEEPCVLVAQTLEISESASQEPATRGDPDATFSPGPRPSADATPVATGAGGTAPPASSP